MDKDITYKCIFSNYRASCFAGGDYCLEYKQGTVIEAVPGSMGIMVFEKEVHARSFLIQNGYDTDGLQKSRILRVRGIGEAKYPNFISNKQSGPSLEMFYAKIQDSDVDINELFDGLKIVGGCNLATRCGVTLTPPPKGTICYSKVEVLD